MNVHTQHCKACDVWFRNTKDRLNHEMSLKHQRNLGLIPPALVCPECHLNVRDMTRHLRTRRHRDGKRKYQASQQSAMTISIEAEPAFILSG